MKIYKTQWFAKWAHKEKIRDSALIAAIEEMEQGLFDADLGGHVYKKRIAIQGRGKSGGVRTIIAYRATDKAFFTYGFAKNKQSNISRKELHVLKIVAETLLAHDDAMLAHLVTVNELVEVNDDE